MTYPADVRPKIYISGAITSDPNFRWKFGEAQQALESAGYYPVNPLNVPNCVNSTCWGDTPQSERNHPHTWDCYIRHDIAALMFCDGVALLDDWFSSPGAKAEVSCADKVHIPCKSLNIWLEKAPNRIKLEGDEMKVT